MCSMGRQPLPLVGFQLGTTNSWAACSRTCDGALEPKSSPGHIEDIAPHWDGNEPEGNRFLQIQQAHRNTLAQELAQETEPTVADHMGRDSVRER